MSKTEPLKKFHATLFEWASDNVALEAASSEEAEHLTLKLREEQMDVPSVVDGGLDGVELKEECT